MNWFNILDKAEFWQDHNACIPKFVQDMLMIQQWQKR
jgi:hypothetical protein